MKRGTRPVPTQLKLLRGNPGKRAVNRREPRPRAKAPSPPAILEGDALKQWHEIAPRLSRLGLLTEIDGTALAAYCQAWARWLEAERYIRDEGMIVTAKSGYPVVSPYVGIANKAMATMRAFLSEFGMTPSARARIEVDGALLDPNSDRDEFELYLAKGKTE